MKMRALDVLIAEGYVEAREEGHHVSHLGEPGIDEVLMGPGTTPPETAEVSRSMGTVETPTTPSGLLAIRPDAKTCEHCGSLLVAFGPRPVCVDHECAARRTAA